MKILKGIIFLLLSLLVSYFYLRARVLAVTWDVYCQTPWPLSVFVCFYTWWYVAGVWLVSFIGLAAGYSLMQRVTRQVWFWSKKPL